MIPILHESKLAQPYYDLGSGPERPENLPNLLTFVGSLKDAETVNNSPALKLLGGSALSEVADIAIAGKNRQAARFALGLSDTFYDEHRTSHGRLASREIAFNGLRHALLDNTVDEQVPATLRLITGLALNIPAARTFAEDNAKDHGDRNELLGLSLILWSQRSGALTDGRTILGWPTYLRQDAPVLTVRAGRMHVPGSDIRVSQYIENGQECRRERRYIDIKSSGRVVSLVQPKLDKVNIQTISNASSPGGSRHLLRAMHMPPEQLTPKQRNRLTNFAIDFFAAIGIEIVFPRIKDDGALKPVPV